MTWHVFPLPETPPYDACHSIRFRWGLDLSFPWCDVHADCQYGDVITVGKGTVVVVVSNGIIARKLDATNVAAYSRHNAMARDDMIYKITKIITPTNRCGLPHPVNCHTRFKVLYQHRPSPRKGYLQDPGRIPYRIVDICQKGLSNTKVPLPKACDCAFETCPPTNCPSPYSHMCREAGIVRFLSSSHVRAPMDEFSHVTYR